MRVSAARTEAEADDVPLLPTPPELAAHFAILEPRLRPVFAIQMYGYGLPSRSPFRPICAEAVASLSDEQRRAVLAYLFDVALARPRNRVFRFNEENAGRWLLRTLGRRRLAWTAEQLAWLARMVRVRHHELGPDGLAPTLALLTGAVERVGAESAPLAHDLRWLESWMLRIVAESHNMSTPYWWWSDPAIEAYAARLHAVLGESGRATLPPQVLDDRDTFGARARAAMLAVADEAAVADLVVLFQEFGSAPRPPARWRRRISTALSEHHGYLTVARALVQSARTQTDPVVADGVWVEHWIAPESQALVRAAAWTVALADPSDQVTSELRDLAAHLARSAGTRGLSTRSVTVVNAVVAVLQERCDSPGGRAAVVGALSAIRLRASNRALSITIDKAVAAVAATAGMSPDELTEQVIPTYGLDAEGCLVRRVGDATATLRATADGGRCEVELSWVSASGRRLQAVPAAVRRDHVDELASLRRLVKDVRTTLPPQRDRLNRYLAARRTWTQAAWRDHYLDHPVVGLLARSLIWRSGAACGLPERGPDGTWRLRAVDGRLVTLDATDPVTLWHPLGTPWEEVSRWRDRLTELEVRQPFKQAFREIYLLTPAEEQTRTYSNRFSAHILRYRQAAALMRAREWRAPGLGDWDMGDEGEAVRSFGSVRACYFMSVVDRGSYEAEYCCTDQVRFEALDPDGEYATVPLADVDVLIFSEAMRDVDLFVGVASIGADPQWLDHQGPRHHDYWQDFSFGALSTSAAVRRDALRRILPRTKIADRAYVDGRFLVVQGQLRSYKIHLGSGNILMSPNDTYLCIVPAQPAARPAVYLPFEEDGRLSLILSKAFLLADDRAISDPTIVAQLRQR
ncbi:DUF4132 domain-containing protein [uncultured Friedmanniella sp.]|uniref:DUF4132 domain-containing protein n=1 Tax=uncultured Friedmanniella sp. TaxID=335381 RepID=UPI0035CC66BD